MSFELPQNNSDNSISMPSQSMSTRIEEVRKADLAKVSQYLISLLAAPMMLHAIYTDITLHGINYHWILLRVFFVPVAMVCVLLYKIDFVRLKYPVFGFSMMSVYIVSVLLYFLTQTGFENSYYFVGYTQVLVAMIILPFSWKEYLCILVPILLSYFLTIYFGSGRSIVVFLHPHVNILITYVLMSIFGFFITRRVRMVLYQKTVEQEYDIVNREKLISDKVQQLTQIQVSLETEKLKSLHLADLGNMATQVAHDIRSPLAALSAVARTSSEFNRDSQQLVKAAINRINSIANDLLEANSKVLHGRKSDHQIMVNLPLQVEQLLTEKRTEYSHLPNVSFVNEIGPDAFTQFVKVVPAELSRILSNIINNAVEAFSGSGKVEISYSLTSKTVEIQIADNGKGIPSNILPQLMKKGATFGKSNGSGLGLYSAGHTLREWGGALEVTSVLNSGTRVKISIPKAATPQWFIQGLTIPSQICLAIVDDDVSIHELWRVRFTSIGFDMARVHNFTKPQDYLQWTDTGVTDRFLICDYMLQDPLHNGIDLLRKAKVHGKLNGILMTSEYENEAIHASCLKLGITLLPKPLVAVVPITLV